MASATLTAKLVGDARGMVDAFGKGGAAAGKLDSTLGSVSKTAAGFVLGAGILKAPGILSGMASAAADDAASVIRLEQAVKNSGASWDALSGSMTTQIELAQKRAFTDDQARSSLALLVAQTGSAEEAQRRFALAMDLSRGANIDLETASKLLGKVTEENVNVLGRYGISVAQGASDTELFGAVQQKFGGQSEAFAKSAAGQGAAVAIAMSEAQESIGYLLLPAMVALTSVLSTAVIPAIIFLTEHSDILLPVLGGIATAIAVALVPATWAYVTALYAQAAAFIVANAGLILIAIALAAVVAGIIIAIKHWDDITAAVGRFAGFLTDTAQGVISGFVDFVDGKFGLLLLLLGPAGLLLLAVIRFRNEFVTAFGWIRDRVKDIVDAIVGSIDRIKGAVQSALDLLSRLASAPGAALGAIGRVGGAVGGAIPGRASGGPVSGGRTYLVGERGPELLTMGGNGYVTPNSAMGMTVYLTVNSLDPQGAADGVVRALGTLQRQGRITNVTAVR